MSERRILVNNESAYYQWLKEKDYCIRCIQTMNNEWPILNRQYCTDEMSRYGELRESDVVQRDFKRNCSEITITKKTK